MRPLLFVVFGFIVISLISCRNDFEFSPSTGGLEFSRDTIYLDTVFTNVSSSTYMLKVYNKSNKDISIPTIKLGKGMDSKYRITVDGMVGQNNRIFTNVELLAKDSMFVFIETTAGIADANPGDFLYTDQIEFHNIATVTPQTVELVTLIQDAYFLYPQRFEDGTTETLPIGDDEIYGFYLDENDPINGNEYFWNNTKPYVIYGYAAVPPNKTLTVEAGARIHFHSGSGLIVGNNASIKVNGLPLTDETQPLQNQVIFEGDRLEPFFEDVAGQWGTIWLSQGSKENEFNNCIIKNATVGLFVTGNTGLSNIEPDVKLSNVQIYNSSNVGILARTGYITGENVVINRAGQVSLACSYGGSYEFTHCTFNNSFPNARQVSVLIDNYIEGAIPPTQPLVKATFQNSIIYGSNQIQMLIVKEGSDTFNYFFDHCLIKFNNISNPFTNNPLYQFATDTEHYNMVYLATNSSLFNPNYFNVNANKLFIDDTSGVVGKGSNSFYIEKDILNRTRSTPPDLGAYQNAPFPE